MSLRKCPDCGQDVSSLAVACPHCGRPNRKTSPIELSGIIIIAVVCAGALIWRLSSRQPPSEAAQAVPLETTIAQPRRAGDGLTATIGYNRRLAIFRVENGDSFPWSKCELSINAQGISAGYTREVESVRPGITEAALLESAEFVDGDGRKFDPATQQVSTLGLACETPNGHRSYEGKF